MTDYKSVRITYLKPLRSTFQSEAADVTRLLPGRPALLKAVQRDGLYNVGSTETYSFGIILI